MRDDYGRLIKAEKGAVGAMREGGDTFGGRSLAVVPTKTVALYSGLVKVGAGGMANIPLAIPDFNGELRLMAVVMSATKLGHADRALTVRDPVVAEIVLPRFLAPGEQWAGGWAVPPHRWAPDAETHLAARETRALIRDALDQLSPAQRIVMTLRDIDGWGPEEVCAALEITPGNQRVLLHRARSRVRAALERHLAAADRA